jgi:hypothetical protein
MDDIEKLIQRYIEAESTDYAVLINGPWGSGKTFYLKSTLFPLIERLPCPTNSDVINDIETDKNKKFYKPVYISLYGLTDINHLQNKIFIEINPFWKSKTGDLLAKGGKLIISPLLKKFTGVSLDDATLIEGLQDMRKTKSYVFCFDDLERLDNKLLTNS